MTVKELIEFLETQPQHLDVAYHICSEQQLLDKSDIRVVELCEPRNDGWVADKRPDQPTRTYLLFPGD